jgi:O-antigen/teichoic acid export membrane protein
MQNALSFGATRIKTRQARTAAAGAIFFFAGSLIWQFSNFLFNSVAAHLLGPDDYGRLAAVVGLLYLANPIFVSLQTVAARTTTSLKSSGAEASVRGYLRYYGVRLTLVAGIVAGFVAIASGPIAEILKVSSRVPIAILSLLLLLSAGTHLQRGILLGSQEFKRLGLSSAVEGVAKVALAALLLTWVWRSVDAAVLAVVAASGIGLGVNWLLLDCLPRGGGRVRPSSHPSRYSLVTVTTLVLLSGLLTMDVIAAHHYLDAHLAGLYAAVSLGGKIVFFALSTVALYLFPKFSSRKDRGLDARKQLAWSLGGVASAAVVLIGGFFLAPHLLVYPLFGSRYAATTRYLGYAALAFGLFALTYLTAMYLLSQRRVAGTLILAFMLLAQLCGFSTFHLSIWSFVWTDITVFTLGTASLCILAFTSRQNFTAALGEENPIAA